MAATHSKIWRIAYWVPWVFFAVLVTDIARAYGSLPRVIASHFNAAGAPNGFATKDSVMVTILVVALLITSLFTFLLSRFSQISGLGWLLMVAEYWGLGVLVMITHGTLEVGLGETHVLSAPLAVWSLIMGTALVIGEAGRISTLRQRADYEHGQLIAEEVHNSPKAGALLAAISVVAVALPTAVGATGPARFVPAAVGLVMLGSAIWALTGFRYRVTTAGFEIRMLGMPIRFVPAMDIASVTARDCDALKDFGGWGIRGVGKMRAYIWGGNQCVHVRTNDGEDLYLGISDAQRLAHELEQMQPVSPR